MDSFLLIIVLIAGAFLFCLFIAWFADPKIGAKKYLLTLKCIFTFKHWNWNGDDYERYILKYPNGYLGEWKE